jgi:hypothetical protein
VHAACAAWRSPSQWQGWQDHAELLAGNTLQLVGLVAVATGGIMKPLPALARSWRHPHLPLLCCVCCPC